MGLLFYGTKMRRYTKIGLVGEMGSGKSTAALTLKDFYAYTVLSFATPVKTLLADYLSYSDPEHRGRTYWRTYVSNNRYHPTIRTSMQFLGDAVARTLHGPDVWVRHMDDEWGMNFDEPFAYPYVVDDARYQNEIDYLRSKGFHILRINRDILERENYTALQIRRAAPDLSDADIDQYMKQWQCHPSESRIRGLDIDEEIEYNQFSEWARENIGDLR